MATSKENQDEASINRRNLSPQNNTEMQETEPKRKLQDDDEELEISCSDDDQSSANHRHNRAHHQNHHQHHHHHHRPHHFHHHHKHCNSKPTPVRSQASGHSHGHCIHHYQRPQSVHLAGPEAVSKPRDWHYHQASKHQVLRNIQPQSITMLQKLEPNEQQGKQKHQKLDTNSTGKFISQLYFLFHLSAIVSLLLHHKNLVRRDATAGNDKPQAPVVVAATTSNDLRFDQPTADSDQIPIAMTLLSPSVEVRPIASYLPSHNVMLTSPSARFGAKSGMQIPHEVPLVDPSGPSQDILVRLLGRKNAYLALQYLLCYLLASSVAILVGFRVIQLCCGLVACCMPNRRRRKRFESQAAALRSNHHSESHDNLRSHHNARLDCTPVLIGSISLGLIQLIVIGLELAYKVDWLGETRVDELKMPLLQFVFVSLLMQFVLGRVARNSRGKGPAANQNCSSSSPISASPLSNNGNFGSNNKQKSTRTNIDKCSTSTGFQNIALAHLLVTHILLWLMKLNSISLFQDFPNLHQTPFSIQISQTSIKARNVLLPTAASEQSTSVNLASIDLSPSSRHSHPSSQLQEFKLPSLALDNSSSQSGNFQSANNHLDRSTLEQILRLNRSPSPYPPSQRPFQTPSRASPSDTKQPVATPPATTTTTTSQPPSSTLVPGPSFSEKRLSSLQLEVPLKKPINGGESNIQSRTEKQGGYPPPFHPPPMASQNSTPPFRSSLPKRMTAFRQSRPSQSQIINSDIRFNSSLHSLIKKPQNGSSVSALHQTTARPKQRARVLVSRVEQPLNEVHPTKEQWDDYPNKPSEMEDPETTVNKEANATSDYDETSLSTTTTTIAPDEPFQGIQDDENSSETSTESPGSEQEIDLDSLLPPVPVELTDDDTNSPDSPKTNESAAIPSWQALVAPSGSANKRADGDGSKQQPTFADYLLPIVHQYHILVIAILFHLWLDGLATPKTRSKALVEQQVASITSDPQLQANETNAKCVVVDRHRWTPVDPSRHVRSKSMDQLAARKVALPHIGESDNSVVMSSGLSRSDSLQSSSSEQLLWQAAAMADPKYRAPNVHLFSNKFDPIPEPELSLVAHSRYQRGLADRQRDQKPTSFVCSVFFGLLLVSGALIVILLGIELLCMLTQCIALLMSVLACLVGLCFASSGGSKQMSAKANYRKLTLDSVYFSTRWPFNSIGRRQAPNRTPNEGSEENGSGSSHYFHSLFLLAAYFCGVSIALNLGKQHSQNELFPAHVVHFIEQRSQEWPLVDHPGVTSSTVLFHLLLGSKGLLLVLQVTLQTILIRLSDRKVRQIYTFLMFANLSLWAMEICEQQEQLRRASLSETMDLHQAGNKVTSSMDDLISLDGFTRFTDSIVTLSHLYHGLVFMQR